MDEDKLEPGKFYWVIPGFDVDDDRTYEEQYKPEPARYIGKDEDGNPLWDMLGTEEWFVARVECECPVPPEAL